MIIIDGIQILFVGIFAWTINKYLLSCPSWYLGYAMVLLQGIGIGMMIFSSQYVV